MTADATIDYEALQQEALRGLVRSILVRVAKSGLPGDHHLYISFDVRAPGVILSKRLREKYPSEMTIVLQHRFWDLAISDERFEVKLTFDGIPERLVVPFAAIKVFLDPSVRYVLHFEEPAAAVRDGATERDVDQTQPMGPRAIGTKKPKLAKTKPRLEVTAQPSVGTPTTPSKPTAVPAVRPRTIQTLPAQTVPPPHTQDGPAASSDGVKVAEAEKPAAMGSAQVVSLDAFRKK